MNTRQFIIRRGDTVHRATKTPQEVIRYGFDWSRRLPDDTIATSIWLADDTLTVTGEDSTDDTTELVIGAGNDGAEYRVTNTVTTASGQTLQADITLRVRAP